MTDTRPSIEPKDGTVVNPMERTFSQEKGQISDPAMHENDAHDPNQLTVAGAIEAIGMGAFQWKLAFSCGFGFLVDQMLLTTISVVGPMASAEFGPKYPTLLPASGSAGLLVGAIVFGTLADNVGRRIVWQLSLFGVSAFTMISASSPNWTALNVFITINNFFGGGNLALDLILFSECTPARWSFIMSGLAAVWGLGSAFVGLIAWPLVVNFSCAGSTPGTCPRSENMGWRYLYVTVGGLCLVMAVIRTFVIGSRESPKWLVSHGRIDEAVDVLNGISEANRSDYRTTMSHFVQSTEPSDTKLTLKANIHRTADLYRGHKQLPLMLVLSMLWLLVGIAYPLYTIFLPYYLQSHGASFGSGSTYITYRDWAVSSIVGSVGPLLAMAMVATNRLKSRRTMAISAFVCAIFCGCFTLVKNEAQNLAFSSMINFWLNALYGVIYSYTPQVLSIENRAIGCGLLMALGRFASLSSPFIATFSDVTSVAPIWVACGLFGAMGVLTLLLPADTSRFFKNSI